MDDFIQTFRNFQGGYFQKHLYVGCQPLVIFKHVRSFQSGVFKQVSFAILIDAHAQFSLLKGTFIASAQP